MVTRAVGDAPNWSSGNAWPIDPMEVLMSASVYFVQLYDLMTMAFKYQVLLCPRPKDVLLVTFNHLDTIKGFIQDSPTILHQVEETFRQLTEVRGSPAHELPAPFLFSFPC